MTECKKNTLAYDIALATQALLRRRKLYTRPECIQRHSEHRDETLERSNDYNFGDDGQRCRK